MSWDFMEICPDAPFSGNWKGAVDWVADVLESLVVGPRANAEQADAASQVPSAVGPIVVSTDPPYYDNIGYADLSDFFYVWLRRTIGDVSEDLLDLASAKGR
jgi:putative DNA methylase